jgi:hypothetical protein
MSGITLADAATTHRRAWTVPVALVAGHALFNALFDPLRGNFFHWSAMLAGGVFYIQPVLFGAWAALGPPPAVKRIPLTLVAYATVLIAPAVVHQFVRRQSPELWIFVLMSILVVFSFIAMLLARRFAGWRIDVPSTAANEIADVGQFSLRNLLIFTAICSALLATGRALASNVASESMTVGDMLFGIGIVLVVLVPAVMAPLAALVEQLPRSLFIAFPFVWAVLTALTVYAIMKATFDSDAETAMYITLVQIGALLGGLATALILRFNGYRLVRRPR